MSADSTTAQEDACYVCGEDNPAVLKEHQLVPDEYAAHGGQNPHVTVCANHKAILESLYDKQLFEAIRSGAEVGESDLGWGESLAEDVDNDSWPTAEELQILPDLELLRLFNHADSLDDTRDVLLRSYTAQRKKNNREHRERIKNLKQLIADIEDDFEKGAPVHKVIGRASDIDLSESEIEDEIEELRQKGEVYEPRSDHLRTT